MAVGDRAQLSDGTRTIDIYRITDSVHNDSFLLVHLPAEKTADRGRRLHAAGAKHAAAGQRRTPTT